MNSCNLSRALLICIVIFCTTSLVVCQKTISKKSKINEDADLDNTDQFSIDDEEFGRVKVFFKEKSSETALDEDSEAGSLDSENKLDDFDLKARIVSLSDVLQLKLPRKQAIKDVLSEDDDLPSENVAEDSDVPWPDLKDESEKETTNVAWELLLNLPYQYPEKEIVWTDAETYSMTPIASALSDKMNSPKNVDNEPSLAISRGAQLYEKAISILNSSREHKAEAYSYLLGASNYGHMDAKILVAWAKLLGDTFKQDLGEAKSQFNELSSYGYPEGHLGLGFMHSVGLTEFPSQSLAFVHYTMAAIDGNDWAQMVLGYRYWAGLGVIANCEMALDFYQKVSDKVASRVQLSGGTIVHRVRLMEEVDNPGYNSGIIDNDLIEYYQLLAEKGDVQSQVGLGQLHYQGGRGVVRDPKKAFNYFQQAAQAGNPIAMAFLGRIYLEGNDVVKPNNDTAYKYFKKAADMGNPVGQSGLGMMYLHGRGVERDYNKALRYFSQAADQGWVDGQLQLGIMYYSGLGVKRDYKLANNYFTYASQSGHVLAFYNLAQMHASGTGIMRSCQTAVELYKNVAERGKWGEKLMEAHMLYKKGKYMEAYILYALLAELGYEVAQSNAAYMLDKGDLTNEKFNQNEAYVRALMFWSRAANQGFSPAQVKIGDYYYYGNGVPVDYGSAVSHYKIAYEQQHNAQAMFNLGYMHEQGLGLKKDMNLAKRCYDTAAVANVDAKVPVALALMKLSVVVALNYFNQNKWQDWFLFINLDKSLGSNWDLYLMTFLIGLLGFIIYFRRPQPFGR